VYTAFITVTFTADGDPSSGTWDDLRFTSPSVDAFTLERSSTPFTAVATVMNDGGGGLIGYADNDSNVTSPAVINFLPGANTFELTINRDLPAGVYQMCTRYYNPAMTSQIVSYCADVTITDSTPIGKIDINPPSIQYLNGTLGEDLWFTTELINNTAGNVVVDIGLDTIGELSVAPFTTPVTVPGSGSLPIYFALTNVDSLAVASASFNLFSGGTFEAQINAVTTWIPVLTILAENVVHPTAIFAVDSNDASWVPGVNILGSQAIRLPHSIHRFGAAGFLDVTTNTQISRLQTVIKSAPASLHQTRRANCINTAVVDPTTLDALMAFVDSAMTFSNGTGNDTSAPESVKVLGLTEVAIASELLNDVGVMATGVHRHNLLIRDRINSTVLWDITMISAPFDELTDLTTTSTNTAYVYGRIVKVNLTNGAVTAVRGKPSTLALDPILVLEGIKLGDYAITPVLPTAVELAYATLAGY
jgi:hypothetical protein